MRIGIDLGGTKIEGVVLADSGAPLFRQRVASPSHNYDNIIDAIASMVAQFEREIGRQATVGVGTPGAPSIHSGLMKNANSTVINGKPLKADLEQALNREVRLANDANCFALSEAVDGAGSGQQVVFGVILGTGVGGGLVVDNQPLLGRNFLGGEWGHNPLPGANEHRRCYCGSSDCIETYLCGSGLLRSAKRLNPAIESTHDLAQRAQEGESSALAVIEAYAAALAKALATVINIADPDIIVLGGGLSNIDALYPLLNNQLAGSVFGRECQTSVVKALHGDASGVRGAAWLWPAA
ncbi:ROK family protein [Litorivivens sp.]|uniref:ROK family protein n=2 Tax=Litorivivens sp. TaxID=2020868 RepID=UPI003562D2CB